MTVNPFNDVQDVPILGAVNSGADLLTNVNALRVGTGARTFKADESGIWLGGNTWASAPFRVDMSGNVTATSASFPNLVTLTVFRQNAVPTSTAIGDIWFDEDNNNKMYRAEMVGADAISAGEWELVSDTGTQEAILKAVSGQTVTGSFSLGVSNVLIDGANKRIVINDGTNDRILIGYGSGLF